MKIQERKQLVNLLKGKAIVLELGVAEGRFAEQILTENKDIIYFGVDRWSDHHDEAEMMRAIERLAKFPNRVSLIRKTFKDALSDFPNHALFDMIYVDGYAHTGQEGGETLDLWWKMLLDGGIFAGHDYDKEKYPQTVEAVDAFIANKISKGWDIELHLTGEETLPSWYIYKKRLTK